MQLATTCALGNNIRERAQGNRRNDLFQKRQTNTMSSTNYKQIQFLLQSTIVQASKYNKQEGALLATTCALGNNTSNRAQENPKNTFLPKKNKPVYNKEQGCH